MKEEEQAIEQMMEVMADRFEQDSFSEESEQEQEHTQKEISEKVDGLLMYQINLPLASTKYSQFMQVMRNIGSTQREKVFRELIRRLQNDPIW